MSKSLKIPKKIAGVKIPKTLRKGQLGEFIASPAGRMVIAEAVGVVVAALTVRKTEAGQHAAEVVSERAADLGSGAGEHLENAGERLGAAFHAALKAFREALHQGASTAGSVPAADEDAGSKKNPASGGRNSRPTH